MLLKEVVSSSQPSFQSSLKKQSGNVQKDTNCAGKGNLWSSTSGTQTFILVGDQIFENWFTAPPKRLIVEDSMALLLSLDGTQCAFSDKELAAGLVASCHALVRWRPEAKTFYGFRNPLEMAPN